jgi:hypothetical protein
MFKPTKCARCGDSLESKTITHQQQWGDLDAYSFGTALAVMPKCAGRPSRL